MKNNLLILIGLSLILCSINCKEAAEHKSIIVKNQKDTFEVEKTAILEVINGETKAACNRDYKSWKEKWLHEKYVTKTYMDFSENSMIERLGWEAINKFVQTYIEEHPESVPPPKMVEDIDVRIFGNGAWVNYEQNDSEHGLKRETRLMEKVNGYWKIAGMHTSIYGLKEKE